MENNQDVISELKNQAKAAVDDLALALSDHGHKWTDDQRIAYEKLVRMLDLPTTVQADGKPVTPGIEPSSAAIRRGVLYIADEVKALMKHPTFDGEESSQGQHSEMRANIMLAYRHLEDARMRIGKVIQAHGGGKSVYPQ